MTIHSPHGCALVFDENAGTSQVYENVASKVVESAIKGINGWCRFSSKLSWFMSSFGHRDGVAHRYHLRLRTNQLRQDVHYVGSDRDGDPRRVSCSSSRRSLPVRSTFCSRQQPRSCMQHPERDFALRVSYVEIYMEKIKDLIDPGRGELVIGENTEVNAAWGACINLVKVDSLLHFAMFSGRFTSRTYRSTWYPNPHISLNCYGRVKVRQCFFDSCIAMSEV